MFLGNEPGIMTKFHLIFRQSSCFQNDNCVWWCFSVSIIIPFINRPHGSRAKTRVADKGLTCRTCQNCNFKLNSVTTRTSDTQLSYDKDTVLEFPITVSPHLQRCDTHFSWGEISDFHPEDGRNMDLWNVAILPQQHPASQPKRLGLETSPQWDLKYRISGVLRQ